MKMMWQKCCLRVKQKKEKIIERPEGREWERRRAVMEHAMITGNDGSLLFQPIIA